MEDIQKQKSRKINEKDKNNNSNNSFQNILNENKKNNLNQYSNENNFFSLNENQINNSFSSDEEEDKKEENEEEINYPKSDFKDFFEDLKKKSVNINNNKNNKNQINKNNNWNQSFFENSLSTNADSYILNNSSSIYQNNSMNYLNYAISYQIQQNQILEQQKILQQQQKLIQQQQKLINKQLKENKKIEKNEKLNLTINIYKILNKQDTRTTIMIKNIPNKFTREMLISIIDYNFKGCYDLLIFPQDSNKCKNFGYGFINFIHTFYIPYFYFLFNQNSWSGTNSQKICELSYSKIQGKNQLHKHYPAKIIFVNIDGENLKNNPNPKVFRLPNIYKSMFISIYPNFILVNQNELFFSFILF